MSGYFSRLNVDGIRTTLGLLVTQTINVLVLLSMVELSGEQVAGISLATGTLLTFAFYFVKPGAPETTGDGT